MPAGTKTSSPANKPQHKALRTLRAEAVLALDHAGLAQPGLDETALLAIVGGEGLASRAFSTVALLFHIARGSRSASVASPAVNSFRSDSNAAADRYRR